MQTPLFNNPRKCNASLFFILLQLFLEFLQVLDPDRR